MLLCKFTGFDQFACCIYLMISRFRNTSYHVCYRDLLQHVSINFSFCDISVVKLQWHNSVHNSLWLLNKFIIKISAFYSLYYPFNVDSSYFHWYMCHIARSSIGLIINNVMESLYLQLSIFVLLVYSVSKLL